MALISAGWNNVKFFPMIKENLSGILTLVTGLSLITPFCGALFNCGCAWPWEGLEAFCNIHDATVVHQCPWCVSIFAGGLSLGLALYLGYRASQLSLTHKFSAIHIGANKGRNSAAMDFLIKTLTGISTFIVTAFIAGWFSAKYFSYPDFLG